MRREGCVFYPEMESLLKEYVSELRAWQADANEIGCVRRMNFRFRRQTARNDDNQQFWRFKLILRNGLAEKLNVIISVTGKRSLLIGAVRTVARWRPPGTQQPSLTLDI